MVPGPGGFTCKGRNDPPSPIGNIPFARALCGCRPCLAHRRPANPCSADFVRLAGLLPSTGTPLGPLLMGAPTGPNPTLPCKAQLAIATPFAAVAKACRERDHPDRRDFTYERSMACRASFDWGPWNRHSRFQSPARVAARQED
jgi:hypothetical protein